MKIPFAKSDRLPAEMPGGEPPDAAFEYLAQAVRELHGAVGGLAAVVKDVALTCGLPLHLGRGAVLTDVHKALVAAAFFIDDARRARVAHSLLHRSGPCSRFSPT